MDERPLDPKRLYLLKHTTRLVTADISGALELNEIGQATVSTSRPLIFDSYRENRATGSFIVIDPATNFTAGAGMILGADCLEAAPGPAGAAERLARLARSAGSDAEAVEALRVALEELLN
jgi:sulfate adenylyltransferase subunit 1 (EFTu-like GTPase family)